MKVLALDLGTSSVRSALFNEKAQIIRGSRAAQTYRVRHGLDHAAELDPHDLLHAAKLSLQRTRPGLTKRKSLVIAGSGFWHSLLGLDHAGNPLTPIYTWADARAAADAALLREQLDERANQQRTGCMLRASFWPAKLIWLRRTEPRLFRRVARWVSPIEWIFEQIFGVRACSHSMASGTGLYNWQQRDWDRELLDLVGLTNEKLNPLHDQLNQNDVLIFSAIGDGAAGNVGSGATRPGVIAINVGTSAAVRTIAAAKTKLPFGLFRFVLDQERNLLGGAISNAGNLRVWALRELRLPNDQRGIEKLLRKSGPGATRLTILPFWVIERAPTWPDGLDAVIMGLTQATSAADLLAAMLASSFHRLADILHELESAVDRAKKIIVSGGILRSPATLQLLADSLGRDLAVCADQEASLRGAALHALEHLGRNALPAKARKHVRYRPSQTARLHAQAARQKALEQILGNQPCLAQRKLPR